MAEWLPTFKIKMPAYSPLTRSDTAREVLKRLTKLDPLPIRAEYKGKAEHYQDYVELVFAIDVGGQLEAVRCRNDIDEKLRVALKGFSFPISFDNPELAPKEKRGS